MKNIFVFLLLNFFVVENLFAQKEDRNWVFGDSVCVDFNNLNSPQVVSKTAVNYEANASYSYPNGMLRCYYASPISSDYYWGKIYNDQNQVMENGDSINQYNSASNGALFIPYPDDSQKLIFFHIEYNFQTHTNYLSYSLIDFSFNSGHGKVVSKNIFLTDSLTEHLLGIQHGNGRDWWIIVKKRNSNKFIKYLITTNGLSVPIAQSIGSISFTAEGEGASSKQGDKLAFITFYGNEDVFNFDRCTGDFTNWIELGIGPYNLPDPTGWIHYGCEFSPDGNRLFVSQHKQSFPFHSKIVQYSFNNSNPIDSKTDVLPDRTGFLLGQLELAPDNKIYTIGFAIGGAIDSSYKYLSVNNNPNDSGIASNLNLFSLYLNGHYAFGGLPNMPNYNLSALDGSACDTLGIDAPNNIVELIPSADFNISPNPTDGNFTITTSTTIQQIEVINLLGEKIYSLRCNSVTQALHLASLSKGVYFIGIKTVDGLVMKKVVVE